MSVIEWTGIGNVVENINSENEWTYKLNMDWDTQYLELEVTPDLIPFMCSFILNIWSSNSTSSYYDCNMIIDEEGIFVSDYGNSEVLTDTFIIRFSKSNKMELISNSEIIATFDDENEITGENVIYLSSLYKDGTHYEGGSYSIINRIEVKEITETIAKKITEYTFNSSTDTLPTFNDGYTYSYVDVDNGDGTITRTITSDTLPTSISFNGKTGLVSVSYLDTSNVTSMAYMFNSCTNLTSLDVSGFVTSNVTNMGVMFYNCNKLTTLDLSNFDTSNVIDMFCMFDNCNNLTTINVSSFDTSNVTRMGNMFAGCNNLTTLDLSNFDTGNVNDISNMFYNCKKLTSLDVSNFDTSNVTRMGNMFAGCNNLTTLDLSNFDTGNVNDMQYMFYNCKKLTSLDISNFDTSKVTNMDYMFNGCAMLTSLDVNNFDTQNVSSMSNMFANCYEVTSIGLSSWNTSSVTSMQCMFLNCHKLTTIDLSKFNTSKVTDMSGMFNNCYELASLDVSSFNTSNVTNMSVIFNYCPCITSLDVSKWDTSKVTDMQQMFTYCLALTELDLSSFDTSNVTNMLAMFWNCSNLTSLDISNFKINTNCNTDNIFDSINKLSHIGMLYCDKETCEKVQSLLPNVDNLQRTIWVQDTNEKDYTSNEYVVVKEYGFEKQKVRLPQLPQPLRAVGNYKDKLYWDNEKGKYCIEQNIGVIDLLDIINDNEIKEFYTDDSNGYIGDDYNYLYCLDGSLYNTIVNDEMLFSIQSIISTIPSGNEKNPEGQDIFIKWGSYDFRICIKKSLASTFEELKAYIENLDPVKIYYPVKPTIIETDITEKIALNTYNPYMKITTNEKEIAPTNMVARFPYKDYFGNDVTVNNLETDKTHREYQAYRSSIDFARGDYVEVSLKKSGESYTSYYANVSDYFYAVQSIVLENDIWRISILLSTPSYDCFTNPIYVSEDNVKITLKKNGFYIDDTFAAFTIGDTDSPDDIAQAKAEIQNVFNQTPTFLIDIITLSESHFNYIRVIQRNSDGDDIGHLGKYNHYYQTYTNYPIAVESEDLCYIHDSYLTEVYGLTIQNETDLSNIQSTGQTADEKYRIKFNISSCPVKFGGGK